MGGAQVSVDLLRAYGTQQYRRQAMDRLARGPRWFDEARQRLSASYDAPERADLDGGSRPVVWCRSTPA